MSTQRFQSVPRCLHLARAASVAVVVIGCLVLAGWTLDVEWLKSVLPGYVSMKANTATGLVLSSMTLVLLSFEKVAKRTRFWTAAMAAVVLALGVLTLSEYLCEWNLGIDQGLFRDTSNAVETSHPGRMSAATAFCFVLIGSALLMSVSAIPVRLRLPILAALGTAVVIVGGLALVGYVSEALLQVRWWNYTGVAVHTATALVLLGGALLAFVKSEGGLAWALDRTITAGCVIGVAVMLVAAGTSYNFTNRLLQTATLVSHTHKVLKEIEDVMVDVAEIESGQRGYIITGDERLLERREDTKIDLHRDVGEIRALTVEDSRQQRRLDQLEPMIAQRTDFGDRSIAVRKEEGFPAAERMISTGTGIRLSKEISGLLKEMRNEEYALLERRESESAVASTTTFLLLPLGVFLSLTILAAGLFFLNAGVIERAQAKIALQQSEARMAGIVASAMDAIISIDESQRIVLFNTAAERMFRCPAAETTGQALDRFMPQHFREHHRQHVEGFGKTGVTSRSLGALTGLRADGEEFPIEASISQIDVAGQKIYTVILRDITERQQAEEKVREQLDELLRWQSVTLGRESRMLELKTEVNQLLAAQGQPARYADPIV